MLRYCGEHRIDRESLRELFASVQWASANHPERLEAAIRDSDFVAAAWDDRTLVGLVAAISDKHMTAYITYAVVRPDRQGQGIGRTLMQRAMARYESMPRIALIALEPAMEFYTHCGFRHEPTKHAMAITILD